MSQKNPNYLLKDLQPSQFYISQAKLSNIQAWFRKDDLSNFKPLPVKVLDGIPILRMDIQGQSLEYLQV